MSDQLRHAIFLFIEKLIRWSIHPKFRAKLLTLFGAKIGFNVRIYEVQFINLSNGFKNLHIADHVHIGAGCIIDLQGSVYIGERSTISPRVVLLSHQNPGETQKNKLANLYRPKTGATVIGKDCWIGANSVIISGISIQDFVAIGAGSVVNKNIEKSHLAAGNPVRIIKKLYPAP